jgi:hypothetical protein
MPQQKKLKTLRHLSPHQTLHLNRVLKLNFFYQAISRVAGYVVLIG